MRSNESDEAFQEVMLPLVSRTFALTIPELPACLRRVVANAYLLCRAADTIEDDVALDAGQKRRFSHALGEVVAGRLEAAPLAAEIFPLLSPLTLAAERELIRHLPRVVALTRGFAPPQRAAIERCLRIMCRGMQQFHGIVDRQGLAAQCDLDRYCYCVAGVVGEMLTDLFCEYSLEIAARRGPLLKLAVSFGQGLQMTNVLKDQWEDRLRGVCWLPREVFVRHGADLTNFAPGHRTATQAAALSELIGVAHAHLRSALDYTLLIPSHASGIRRFCYWTIMLAVFTLRRIHQRSDFAAGIQVKISRRCVAGTMLFTRLAARSDATLCYGFAWAARGLPLHSLVLSRGAFGDLHSEAFVSASQPRQLA